MAGTRGVALRVAYFVQFAFKSDGPHPTLRMFATKASAKRHLANLKSEAKTYHDPLTLGVILKGVLTKL